MALKGTIQDFSLADIFQLIGIQRKTGVLVLSHEEVKVSVSFLSGCVVSADSSDRPLEDRLGAVLVKSGKVTDRHLQEALRTQKHTPQRLGRILIDQKAITPQDLTDALRLQVTQIVHHLFRWRTGEYDFNQEETIDYDRDHFVPIAAESILMEGARMIDEWPIIERRIRGFDVIPKRRSAGADPVSVFETDLDFGLVGGDAAEDAGGSLTEDETLVYGLVDGRSTIQDIIDRSHLGEFETCRVLYDLMNRDLVEESTGLVARDPNPAAPAARSFALRAALVLLPALAVLSVALALYSPVAPLGSGGHDPFGVERIRLHLSQARVGRVDQAVRLYHLEKQSLPASLPSLVREGFVAEADLQDPWGRPYLYETTAGGYVITGHDASGAAEASVSREIRYISGSRLAHGPVESPDALPR